MNIKNGITAGGAHNTEVDLGMEPGGAGEQSSRVDSSDVAVSVPENSPSSVDGVAKDFGGMALGDASKGVHV